MPRFAAVDFGLKRIGLALSDESGKIALPFAVIAAHRRHEESAKRVMAALKPYNPVKILVGLPLLLNGKRSEMTELAAAFAEALEKEGAIIECVDERLSTAHVEKTLKGFGVKRKERTNMVDMAAAALLLQAFLDKQKS